MVQIAASLIAILDLQVQKLEEHSVEKKKLEAVASLEVTLGSSTCVAALALSTLLITYPWLKV